HGGPERATCRALRFGMRLAHLRPEELDEEQRALYDALTADTRVDRTLTMRVSMTDEAGRLQGPFNAMLHQPRIGDALQELSRRLRFDGVLTKRTREIVILVVAASQRSEFE